MTPDTKGVTGECTHVVHHHKRYKICWCEFMNRLTTICVVLHFIGSACGRDLAVSSSPRPWIAVFVLPEKESTFFKMAVTKSDLDPKIRKMSITYYNWLFEVKSQIWPSKEMSHDFLKGQLLGLVGTPLTAPVIFFCHSYHTLVGYFVESKKNFVHPVLKIGTANKSEWKFWEGEWTLRTCQAMVCLQV